MSLSIKLLVISGAITVSSVMASLYLYERNGNLKDKLSQLEAVHEQTVKNLVAVGEQLAREQKTRAAAEYALRSLESVDGEDYETPLPDSITDVLSDFHSGLR